MEIITCRLIIGFLINPEGKVSTISDTSLQLFAVGEDGRDPDDILINFTAG